MEKWGQENPFRKYSFIYFLKFEACECITYSKKEMVKINDILKKETMYKVFKEVNTLKNVVVNNQVI